MKKYMVSIIVGLMSLPVLAETIKAQYTIQGTAQVKIQYATSANPKDVVFGAEPRLEKSLKEQCIALKGTISDFKKPYSLSIETSHIQENGLSIPVTTVTLAGTGVCHIQFEH